MWLGGAHDLDDLGRDGDRDLLRGARADLEADWRVDAGDVLVGHAFGAQALRAVLFRALLPIAPM